MRVLNTNRLSNTPKLKQTNKTDIEGEKTFKQLLTSKENETIKLECSEKLFKYI